MATLLVLGSKPDPELPPAGSFDALACANASGRSALNFALMEPEITVMTTVLTSGSKPANDLALQALKGLRTRRLYLLPRPEVEASLRKRLTRWFKHYRMRPGYVVRQLKSIGYGFDEVTVHPLDLYHRLILRLCANDPDLAATMAQKQPSTGMMALALGIDDGRFDHFVLSGFSFEITHAYAHNPLIDQSGTTRSKHADTDVMVLKVLNECHKGLSTTEPTVHERTGIALLQRNIPATGSA